MEKIDKSREYVDRLLKINPLNKDGLVLKGWVEVYAVKESKNFSKNALQYFENVLKTNNRNIEALFGKAKYHELCGHFEEAKDILSTLVVVYNKFTPPLIEKFKVELALQDWEQADDTANRVLALEPRNIEASKFKILQVNK